MALALTLPLTEMSKCGL